MAAHEHNSIAKRIMDDGSSVTVERYQTVGADKDLLKCSSNLNEIYSRSNENLLSFETHSKSCRGMLLAMN